MSSLSNDDPNQIDLDHRFDLYSLVLSINQIERAWIKGHFNSNPDDYYSTIQNLLAQYNALQATMTLPLIKVLDFTNFNGLELGLKRVKAGLGDTPSNSNQNSNNNGKSTGGAGDRKRIAEATSAFITLLDAIKLNLNTKNDLHPLLVEVVVKCQDAIGEDAFKGKRVLVPWLIKINQLKGDNLSLNGNEMDNFLLDVESSYDQFIDNL